MHSDVNKSAVQRFYTTIVLCTILIYMHITLYAALSFQWLAVLQRNLIDLLKAKKTDFEHF